MDSATDYTQNAFQWKNLYHRKFGPCTYPPPLPRNPSTTLPTSDYPNHEQFVALTAAASQQQQQPGSGGHRESLSIAPYHSSTSPRNSLSMQPTRNQFGEGSIGRGRSVSVTSEDYGSGRTGTSFLMEGGTADDGLASRRLHYLARTSFLNQKKHQQQAHKRKEYEERARQNPYHLPEPILQLQQWSWSFLMEDTRYRASALEAETYCKAANIMHQRLLAQRSAMITDGELPFLATSRSQSVISRSQTSRGPQRTGDGHVMHAILRREGCLNDIEMEVAAHEDEELTALLLSYMPFFTLISPPQVVENLSTLWTPRIGTAPPIPAGGAADPIGFPVFSQYASWAEAYEMRQNWPSSPFHFFLTKDASFNFAHVTAILIMLESVWKWMHVHNQIVEDETAKARKGSAAQRSSCGWDGTTRRGSGRCLPNLNPNSCPLLAMETACDDLILLFEHSNGRSTLHMARSVLKLLLEKGLRPHNPDQLFGKEVLMDIVNAARSDTSHSSEESDSDLVDKFMSDSASEESSNDGEGGENSDENSNEIFGEREFQSLFVFGQWFIDGMLGMQGVAVMATKPKDMPSSGDRPLGTPGRRQSIKISTAVTTSATSASFEPSVVHQRMMQAAKCSTQSLVEAVSRFQHARRMRIKLAKFAAAQSIPYSGFVDFTTLSPTAGASAPLSSSNHNNNNASGAFITNVQSIADPNDLEEAAAAAAADGADDAGGEGGAHPEETELNRILRDMPAASLRLVTPLVFLGSYLRLHGTSWATVLLKDLLEMLRAPTMTLYILNEDLRVPPNMLSALTMMIETKARERKPRQSVVFSSSLATGEPITPSKESRDVSPSSRGSSASNISGGATTTTADDELSNGFLEGLPNPIIRQFYESMLQKEAAVAHGISKTVTTLMRSLAESNSTARMPAGIAHLLTQFCATVHCHILSNVVVHRQQEPPPETIEPNSPAMVEFYLGLLEQAKAEHAAGLSTPTSPHTHADRLSEQTGGVGNNGGTPNTPNAPSGLLAGAKGSAAQRKPMTFFVGEETNHSTAGSFENAAAGNQDGLGGGVGRSTLPRVESILRAAGVASDPNPSSANHHRMPSSPHASRSSAGDDDDADEAPSPQQQATNSSNNNTQRGGGNLLVHDIETYRLAKFLLFDMWLIPLLNNAQRYGLLPPHAPAHQVRNLNAFARYLKIVLHAPYVQREEQWRAAEGSKRMAPAYQVQGCRDRILESHMRPTTVSPFVSGVYNASTGFLVQLYRPPEVVVAQAAADAAASPASADESPAAVETNNNNNNAFHKSARERAGGSSTTSGAASKTLRRASMAMNASSRASALANNSVNNSSTSNNKRSKSLTGLRAADAEYYELQDGSWPAYSTLSYRMKQLNRSLGIAPMDQPPLSRRAYQKSAAGLALQFCRQVATDSDPHRVVVEFQVPPEVAMKSTDSLLSIVTGTHPAMQVYGELVAPTDATKPRRSTAVSLGRRASSASNASLDESVKGLSENQNSKSDKARGAAVAALQQQVVAHLYLRCLHSSLLHSATAAVALDHVFLHNRKLFAQLMKPYTLNTTATDERNYLALSLYPHILVGSRDQPLLDAHALTTLLAVSEHTAVTATSTPVVLPSSFLAARRRFLVRRMFLSTGYLKPTESSSSSSAAVRTDAIHSVMNAFTASRALESLLPAGPDANNKQRRQSTAVSLITAPEEKSSATPQRGGGGGGADSDASPSQPVNATASPSTAVVEVFVPWWHHVAAALCAKASSVIAESTSLKMERWEKHVRHANAQQHRRSTFLPRASAANPGKGLSTIPAAPPSGQKSGTRGKASVVMVVAESPRNSPRGAQQQQPSHSRGERRSAEANAVPIPPALRGGSRGGLDMTSSVMGGSFTARRLSGSLTSRDGHARTLTSAQALVVRWRNAVTDLLPSTARQPFENLSIREDSMASSMLD